MNFIRLFLGLAFIIITIIMFWYFQNKFLQTKEKNDKSLNLKFKQSWINISNKELQNFGKTIFLSKCSKCHGKNGKGNNGKAQNLTKRISKSSVLETIKHGANNFKTDYPSGMPANIINEKKAQSVSQFIANGMIGENKIYNKSCLPCHGKNGKGMNYVAPNIKFYDNRVLASVLKNGKKSNIGTMPNFTNILNDTQIKMLGIYLKSLKNNVE